MKCCKMLLIVELKKREPSRAGADLVRDVGAHDHGDLRKYVHMVPFFGNRGN